MKLYHKIQSVYKRDEKGRFLMGQWATEAIGYLANLDWNWTEKVDGTNIRIWKNAENQLMIGGRTERAQLPKPLVKWIHDNINPTKLADGICYYGEGYGGKIQKAGSTYGPVQRFVLFDAYCDGYWLKRESVEELGENAGMKVVPLVGHGTLHEAIAFVKVGQISTWGPFTAEGIVCRPAIQLFDRQQQRVLVKVKAKDFKHNK